MVYQRYPAPPNVYNQNQPSVPPLSSASAYSQYRPAGYPSLAYGSATPASYGQFSQPMQTPPSSSQSQNIYSTAASIASPPTMMASGDVYSGYLGRSRTVPSSSYSSGYHLQKAEESMGVPNSSGIPTSGIVQQPYFSGISR